MYVTKDYLETDFDFGDEGLVEVFDELPLWAAPFGLKLLDKIILKRGMTVLDIGFGAGFPLTEIAMRLGADSRIIGIDPWTAAIRRTRKKIRQFSISNIEIIEGIAERIPVEAGTFHLIVSNNGINNVSDMEQAISECSRVIKPGGQFLQTMNLNSSMMEFYHVMTGVLKSKRLFECLKKMDEHIYKKRKPLPEVTGILERNRFQIRDVEHSMFDYKFIDGTALLRHYFIRMAFLNAWKEIVPAERQEEIFTEIEKQMNELSEATGYFRLSIPFAVIDAIKT
jgi:ubiquinone/menaquinone biosynthesis C-methylase UbiE